MRSPRRHPWQIDPEHLWRFSGQSRKEEQPDRVVIHDDPSTKEEMDAVLASLELTFSARSTRLKAVLEGLSDRDRAVFVDRAVGELTFRELSKRHALGLATVYGIVSEVKRQLTTQLAQEMAWVTRLRREAAE